MPHRFDTEYQAIDTGWSLYRMRPVLSVVLVLGIWGAHLGLHGTEFEGVEMLGVLMLATLQLLPQPRYLSMHGPEALQRCAESALDRAKRTDATTGIILIQIDDQAGIYGRYEPAQLRRIEDITRARAHQIAPNGSQIIQVESGVFGIVLAPSKGMDLTTALTLCKCIQNSAADPITLQQGEAQISLSAGVCLSSRLRDPAAEELEEGARAALIEANLHGPEAIRSYSDVIGMRERTRSGLLSELDNAIANGDLRAHFQPQISALTGDISGFEALVRWHHPERGLIPPGEFLPLLERNGDMIKVSMVMISQSLQALKRWDDRGIYVPRVGVNFSTPELKNKNLLDHIKFELDRHGMSPDRLAIEVLETVVAGHEDETIVGNLAGLAHMGSCIDLDDFGTGHASITNIQRFSIERIKIDRSFVKGIDTNIEQQNMVAAILTMAERLGLSTLAEGVESEDERQLLTELGCGHLQGFGIGRPMSFEDSLSWISAFYASGNQFQQQRSHTN